MTRIVLFFALMLPATALAQTPGEKSLRFKVDLGGMNIGQFAAMDIKTHTVALNGNDVLVVANTNAPDTRPIVLTGGKIGSMMMRILKPRVGEQMTVGIQVVPLNAAPGKRCTFQLDHAHLKALGMDTITLRPSELAKFTCTK